MPAKPGHEYITQHQIFPGWQHIRVRSVAQGVDPGPWPAQIRSEEKLVPELVHRTFWFTGRLRIGVNNGYRYRLRFLKNGVLAFEIPMEATDAATPGLQQTTVFGNSSAANGMSLLRVAADGANANVVAPFTFIADVDEWEMIKIAQYGPDSAQRPHWTFDIISQGLNQCRSLPGLIQSV